MVENTKKSAVLEKITGEKAVLSELVDYSDDSIVSKTLIDKQVGTITLFAFDTGQKLSEHTAPYDAYVQVLDGTGHLTIGGSDVELSAGQVVIMPANVPHSVTAEERFKMLLVMIRE
jgi:quercetin dioxygenase-like cupin family protein